MKKYSLALLVFSLSIAVFFSCKKINEATNIGDDLIPPVDNVNTFAVELEARTINKLYNDSTKVGYFDPVALGDIDDPRFGNLHANFAFKLSAAFPYRTYPFKPKKDTIHTIDSVVLSLAYAGAYGDTIGNGVQTVSVYEVDPNAGFSDTVLYKYNDPASDFNGSLLGSTTYTIKNLKDTIFVKEAGDTAAKKVTNVLRIPLNNSLGYKFMDFDTVAGNPNSGFRNDSLFKTLFHGLSVKASNSGNALAYFNLADQANTRLTIYYRYKKPNSTTEDTTGSVSFVHSTFGQANYVDVQPGGNWAAAIDNPAEDEIYIQGSPSGAYAEIVFPALDTMKNAVIHRADLIANVVNPSIQFTPPARLFLDRYRKGAVDSAYIFDQHISIGFNGSVDYSMFGGELKSNTYKFNITRYVQGILTRNERNDTLRLYAPFKTIVYSQALSDIASLPVNSRIADGRVVLGGGSYVVPNQRLRLRIIYSKL
ncbi:MAG TPA: DUF4270 family protein [Flavisolibacter sp.]